MKKEQKSEILKVRVTPTEKKELLEFCHDRNITMSKLVVTRLRDTLKLVNSLS